MNRYPLDTTSETPDQVQGRSGPPKVYVRPGTRGDLRDKLLAGIECEVVTTNVSITSMMLDHWLDIAGRYKVRLSENNGWSVFYPHQPSQPDQP